MSHPIQGDGARFSRRIRAGGVSASWSRSWPASCRGRASFAPSCPAASAVGRDRGPGPSWSPGVLEPDPQQTASAAAACRRQPGLGRRAVPDRVLPASLRRRRRHHHVVLHQYAVRLVARRDGGEGGGETPPLPRRRGDRASCQPDGRPAASVSLWSDGRWQNPCWLSLCNQEPALHRRRQPGRHGRRQRRQRADQLLHGHASSHPPRDTTAQITDGAGNVYSIPAKAPAFP
jgi:hypothetical protein